MIEPLPADCESVEPLQGSPVLSNRFNACLTVLPISKHRPLLLRYPCRHHFRYRFIWSWGSKPLHSIRLSARQRAIEVSSDYSPGFSPNGPPATMSLIGLKVPGLLNSRVAPRASPTASPIRHPRYRSRSIFIFLARQFSCAGFSSQGLAIGINRKFPQNLRPLFRTSPPPDVTV